MCPFSLLARLFLCLSQDSSKSASQSGAEEHWSL